MKVILPWAGTVSGALAIVFGISGAYFFGIIAAAFSILAGIVIILLSQILLAMIEMRK